MNQSLNDIINIVVFVVLVVTLWVGMFFIAKHLPRKVTYDCSIAEISPDMPLEAKMECRKLRMIKE
jgi:hypothetical protein